MQHLLVSAKELVNHFPPVHHSEGGCVLNTLSRILHVVNLGYHIFETRKLHVKHFVTALYLYKNDTLP